MCATHRSLEQEQVGVLAGVVPVAVVGVAPGVAEHPRTGQVSRLVELGCWGNAEAGAGLAQVYKHQLGGRCVASVLPS